MSEQNPTAQGSAAPVTISKNFKDMGFLERAAYVWKALLCILTFGFAYPNIFSD